MSKNSYLYSNNENTVANYLELENPGYALMISGQWGYGKTFFITNLIKNEKKENDVIYVSLYGVKTVNDINNLILISYYKNINFGVILNPAIDFFNIYESFKIADWKKFNKNKNFIFDDFERANLSLNELFGYINRLTEHDECNVIIVCNEDIFKDNKKYKSIKEKTVGQTCLITQDSENIVTNLITKISSTVTRNILLRNIKLIIDIFKKSKSNNYRVFYYVIRDCDIFFQKLHHTTIDEKYLIEIIELIFILSIEFKVGNLSQDMLKKRPTSFASVINKSVNHEDPVYKFFVELNLKYSYNNILNNILNNSLLENILTGQSYNYDEIEDSITNYKNNIILDENWKKILNITKIEENDFNYALKNIYNDFNNSDDLDEIIVIFCVLVFLHEEDLILVDIKNIINDSMKKVNNYFNSISKFKYEYKNKRYFDERNYKGYHLKEVISNNVIFDDFIDYIISKNEEIEKTFAEREAQQLLSYMDLENLDKFCEALNSESCKFVAVLNYINIDLFFDKLIKLTNENLNKVFTTLIKRQYVQKHFDSNAMKDVDFLINCLNGKLINKKK